jgi:hypothetical protein
MKFFIAVVSGFVWFILGAAVGSVINYLPGQGDFDDYARIHEQIQ